jgi:type II secretory pathway pseudopilin PulG
MHLALPKPLHGWRAFTGEVAVVVLGVVIALFAQQVVQSFNDRSAAEQARNNIRAELAVNIGRMQSADECTACLERRLDELANFISEARKGRSLADVTWIGRPPVWDMENSRWQSATASGRSSLFEKDEQAAIADVYSLMVDYQAEERVEEEAWAKLRGLAGLETLSEARDATLSDALQQARYSAWLLKIDSRQAQDAANGLHIRGLPIAYSVSPLCIPTNVTKEEAQRRLGYQDAEPL